MMYNNKLAVALKSAGKVLREFGETVYVPFGSEYSVLIKNLHSVRALVTVTVDGVDVGDGTRFIVDANDSVELERFIKNGNLKTGNRFKFIERTDSVEQHRGVGIEDGIVRVEFNFERKLELTPPKIYRSDPWNQPDIWCNSKSITKGTPQDSFCSTNVSYTATVDSLDVTNMNADLQNDAGITVPGSVSDQKFTTGDWFPTEAKTHVIVLQMLGQTEDNKQVTKPVTVKAKPKCTTCGRTNKATAKFCTECGTSLTIV